VCVCVLFFFRPIYAASNSLPGRFRQPSAASRSTTIRAICPAGPGRRAAQRHGRAGGVVRDVQLVRDEMGRIELSPHFADAGRARRAQTGLITD
jgi:hypothetical protein